MGFTEKETFEQILEGSGRGARRDVAGVGTRGGAAAGWPGLLESSRKLLQLGNEQGERR